MDGKVVESNAAIERMLGYTHEELRGMHFREFAHPNDPGIDAALFQEMVEGKRESYEIELRYLRKDRSARWVRLTVSRVRASDGQPEFVIRMAEDITERKRTEQQLRCAMRRRWKPSAGWWAAWPTTSTICSRESCCTATF